MLYYTYYIQSNPWQGVGGEIEPKRHGGRRRGGGDQGLGQVEREHAVAARRGVGGLLLLHEQRRIVGGENWGPGGREGGEGGAAAEKRLGTEAKKRYEGGRAFFLLVLELWSFDPNTRFEVGCGVGVVLGLFSLLSYGSSRS